jgi:hypothetical protein
LSDLERKQLEEFRDKLANDLEQFEQNGEVEEKKEEEK